ncbi:hypothetical protein SAMN04515665_11777 [Blastococcus sp. DSM 46786]|uniref:hypothetical protein n=1 Tax=Blastococcus sp. DSM 46786 TaxID=1798227 RepID=UPI0008B9AED7|nr:hypothetical protein [Blastococcus sp. DSM 46786]SEL70461.1 hypothetical protein SAMN04515665_11777 [Blastococcus sp. DSM 46786]
MWVRIAVITLVLSLGSGAVEAARLASKHEDVARRGPEASGRAMPDIDGDDRAGPGIEERQVPASGSRAGVSSAGRV